MAGDLLKQINANWTDETLAAMDEMHGEMWTRGLTARILLDYQTHHWVRITALMRQA
ncbi:MAG: hypothetical protein JXA73_12045 [Acidobacteria bacterium]|nr:hypothetical protein [Acidobacteriota bacterium]